MEWLAFDNGYANVCQFRCAYNAVERCRWWQRLRKSAISHAVLLAANYRSLFIDLSRFSKDSGGFFQKILTVSFVFSLSLSLSLSLSHCQWRFFWILGDVARLLFRFLQDFQFHSQAKIWNVHLHGIKFVCLFLICSQWFSFDIPSQVLQFIFSRPLLG